MDIICVKEGDLMENYITGGMIKKLREEKGITQAELAGMIGVSDKAVQNGRGRRVCPI